MSLEDPGTLTVTCDECEDQADFDTTGYCGDGQICSSFGIADETLEEAGWVRDGDETYCPKCVKKREGED